MHLFDEHWLVNIVLVLWLAKTCIYVVAITDGLLECILWCGRIWLIEWMYTMDCIYIGINNVLVDWFLMYLCNNVTICYQTKTESQHFDHLFSKNVKCNFLRIEVENNWILHDCFSFDIKLFKPIYILACNTSFWWIRLNV